MTQFIDSSSSHGGQADLRQRASQVNLNVSCQHGKWRDGGIAAPGAWDKLWKDEKAHADALEADLPPVVADGMRALWVVAVEHAERVLEDRRGYLESQLGRAQEELGTVQAAHQRIEAASEPHRATG
jgi:hypothetical protein